MKLPGDARERGRGKDNSGGQGIEQELRQRLRRLDQDIPIPEKARAEHLLYQLEAQKGRRGRKSQVPSWARTLSLGLACCFVAVFGLWGFFSGAFESLFGSENLSTGDNSAMQGYRAGDAFSSAASAEEEEEISTDLEDSGSFLIESVTYSGMTDGGDLYYISRSYSDLQKLLCQEAVVQPSSGEDASNVQSGSAPATAGGSYQNAQALAEERHFFGEGTVLFYQSEGALYRLNTEDNTSTRLMELPGKLKLARLDGGFLLVATECQGTRPDGQTETAVCASVYAEGAYDTPVVSRTQSGRLLDMALANGRAVVLTEKSVSAQSSLEELAVYAGDTPQQLEEVSSSMAFVLPIQDADRYTILSALPLDSSEEPLCRFVVGGELTADLAEDGIYLFSDSRWSVCMVRFQADAQLSFYNATVLPGNFGGRYYSDGKDSRWLLVEEDGSLKAYQLTGGLSSTVRGSYDLEGSLTDAAIASHYLYFSNGSRSWRVDLNGFMRPEDLTELHYAATSIRVLGSKLLLYDETSDTLQMADVEQPDRWAKLFNSSRELSVESWMNAQLLREKTDETGELVAVRIGDALEIYELDGLSLQLIGHYQASELFLAPASDSAAGSEESGSEPAPSLGTLYLWQDNSIQVLDVADPPASETTGEESGSGEESSSHSQAS